MLDQSGLACERSRVRQMPDRFGVAVLVVIVRNAATVAAEDDGPGRQGGQTIVVCDVSEEGIKHRL